MRAGRIILRSLVFYRARNLGVVLGAAVATAVLTGSLLVGDSVRGTLREQAMNRIGRTVLAADPAGRYFREALASELGDKLRAPVAPLLRLSGTLQSTADQAGFAPNVRILGVDERFWSLSPAYRQAGHAVAGPDLGEDGAALSESLAHQLGVRVGGRVLMRFARPSPLTLDAPLASDEPDQQQAILSVRAVLGDEQFAQFDLQSGRLAPANVFVPLAWLQKQAELAESVSGPARANVLLVGTGEVEPTIEAASAALREGWTLDDAECQLRTLPDARQARVLELRSRRVFLDEPVVAAALKADAPALGVLAYLANRIDLAGGQTGSGGGSIAYSMAAALGWLRRPVAGGPTLDDPACTIVPVDIGDDEAIVSAWLANEDFHHAALAADPTNPSPAAPADGATTQAAGKISISYFVARDDGRLVTRTTSLRVRGVPRAMDSGDDAALMQELMPLVPGLPEKPTLANLKLGSRIDKSLLDRDRIQLDRYWSRYHGTPKLFVSLHAGRGMWGGRFGDLTAVRFPASAEQAVRTAVRDNLDPATLGVTFQPIRGQALAGSVQGTDFGQLFIGLSMFIVASSVMLMGLVFVFGVQQRSSQIGVLMAAGFGRRKVRLVLLAEGSMLALAGAVIGSAGGLAYTQAMVVGLGTIWRDAVSGADIHFHASAASLLIGGVGGLAAAVLAIWLALLRQTRRPVLELLTGQPSVPAGWHGGHAWRDCRGGAAAGLVCAAICIAAAVAMMFFAGEKSSQQAGVFFGAGVLLLAAGLGATHAVLSMRRRGGEGLTLLGLGCRNAARRKQRSLAVVALLACGVFLVTAVGAFRIDPDAQALTGTGGFDLYAESAVGLSHDFGTAEGRKSLRLDDAALAEVRVVPLRVHDGDDASCLNLNRPTAPRLIGVSPERMAEASFSFTDAPTRPGDDTGSAWLALNASPADGAVAGIADAETIQWALGKSIGGAVVYSDQSGREFRVRLVAATGTSILQGSVIISQSQFLKHYPSTSGWRAFLIAAPPGKADGVKAALAGASSLRRAGLGVSDARVRLAELLTVQNTYLSIFQMLGGLGLVLGSAGLGVVLARNAFERRSELALLRAVGFAWPSVRRLMLMEHIGLLAAGLVVGVASGLAAAAPALSHRSGAVAWTSLAIALAGIAAIATAATCLATRLAIRGPLVRALQPE